MFFGPTPLAIISHQLCYIAFDLLLVRCYRVLTLHRNWQNWSEMSESASPLGVAALLSLWLHYCNDLYITVTPCLASDIWGRTWLVNQSGQLALFCPSHLPYCHPSLYLACKMSKYILVKFMVIDQKRPTGLTLHNYAGSYVLQSRGISATACACVCGCACMYVYVVHSVFAYFGDLHVSYHTDPHPHRLSVSV